MGLERFKNMPTQAKNLINFKNAICPAMGITGEPCAGLQEGRWDLLHPASIPGELIPPQLCPGIVCTENRLILGEHCPWKGRTLPHHQVSSLSHGKGLSWRVWFGSCLAGCPPCHCLAMNLPQLFLQQLDAAFSSSEILKTVSFPKSMERVLGCSSRSDCWGAFPSLALWM